MQLQINHKTEYHYDRKVDYALQKVRLRPPPSPVQRVLDWSLEIHGGRIEASYRDHHGNHTDLVSIDPGAETLSIVASGKIETTDTHGVFGHTFGRAPLWYFKQATALTIPGPQVDALAMIMNTNRDALSGLHDMSEAVLKAIPYELGGTDARTTAEEALTIGRGVCQDHAHIFVSASRRAGLPARYVSGYLMINDQVDQDATHAWAEVFDQDLGWVGFDVSNGVSPDDKYVRIAIGRDAHDAAPITGMRMGASDETMEVSLQVQQ